MDTHTKQAIEDIVDILERLTSVVGVNEEMVPRMLSIRLSIKQLHDDLGWIEPDDPPIDD